MLKKSTLCLGLFVFAAACDEDDPKGIDDKNLLRQVVTNYADIVTANYEDALSLTQMLKTKVDALVANPTQEVLTDAKNAWLEAREAYGQTEAFRLYGGPIDDEDGPEGQLNAWPLDESYIDYVEGATNGDDAGDNDGSNIINNTDAFPTISKEVIASLNEDGSETNISSGYHAIEFLLWGQDKSDGAGGGARSYTDYVVGAGGTNANQQRRGTYLKEVTQLVVDDLSSLVDEWKTGGSYRAFFTSDSELKNSIEKILSGIGKLSKGELAGERMFVAWDLRSKEDEHSCFSDNTHRDIVNNATGIQNVFLGTYTRTDGSVISGKGIYDILATVDKTLADEIKALMVESVAACGEIQAPFDQEFLEEPGRTRIKTAIDLLRNQGDLIAEAAAVFGFVLDPDDIG